MIQTNLKRTTKDKKTILLRYYLLIFVTSLITVYPLFWMLSQSLKNPGDFYSNIWGMPKHIIFGNYTEAFSKAHLLEKFRNSTFVTFFTLLLLVPICCLAGYSFARVNFRGKKYFLLYILGGIVMPLGISAVPILTIIIQMHLYDSLVGLILVYVAQSISFGTFLMLSFFITIPIELEEAALIDGCNRLQAFRKIVLPLAKPGLITLIIFSGIGTWNEFFLASVLIRNQSLQTIPLGLVDFTSRHTTDFPVLFATISSATVPLIVLFIVLQRRFVDGLTAGAVKL